MKTKRAYRRRLLNLSVNRGLQLRMIAAISGILFVCLLLSSAVYFQLANQEIGASFKLFHIKARNFLDMLLPVIGFSFLLSLVCGIAASLFFPKNYAGTLYRLEEDLKKILKTSDLRGRMTLREGDPAQELAVQINLLLSDYRDRAATGQQAVALLEHLSGPGAVPTQADLRPICGQLKECFGALQV